MSKPISIPRGATASPFGVVGEPVYLGQGLLPNTDRVMQEKMPGNKDNARFFPFNGVLASFIVTNNALDGDMIRNIHDTKLSDAAKNKAKNLAEPTCADLSEARDAASQ
jgi:hypothetical protein